MMVHHSVPSSPRISCRGCAPSACRRCISASSGILMSMCTRFFTTFGSGTLLNQRRRPPPAPGGSMGADSSSASPGSGGCSVYPSTSAQNPATRRGSAQSKQISRRREAATIITIPNQRLSQNGRLYSQSTGILAAWYYHDHLSEGVFPSEHQHLLSGDMLVITRKASYSKRHTALPSVACNNAAKGVASYDSGIGTY